MVSTYQVTWKEICNCQAEQNEPEIEPTIFFGRVKHQLKKVRQVFSRIDGENNVEDGQTDDGNEKRYVGVERFSKRPTFWKDCRQNQVLKGRQDENDGRLPAKNDLRLVVRNRVQLLVPGHRFQVQISAGLNTKGMNIFMYLFFNKLT